MKLAITGATGLVGSRIVELLKNDLEIIPISSSDCDITKSDQVREKLTTTEFDVLLHLAAYTNVDGAETEREKAHTINVTGTKNLFEVIQSKGSRLIYISTDFVFDGTNPPYDEDSTPNPQGYYGLTKYEGEKIVKDHATIVRISYPYGISTSSKPDFVQRLRSLLSEGKELKMITDSSMTPTFIDDIANALKHLITHNAERTANIYHLVGSQSVSPFESGQMIARHFNLPLELIRPITYIEYMQGRAPRPQWSEIKSKKNMFCPMKSFSEGLATLG